MINLKIYVGNFYLSPLPPRKKKKIMRLKFFNETINKDKLTNIRLCILGFFSIQNISFIMEIINKIILNKLSITT